MKINIGELTERKTSAMYPNLTIVNPNDTVPVMVKILEKGDMQLLIEFKGVMKVVSTISESAMNIDKLLRTCGQLIYAKAENKKYIINDILEYMECISE